MNYWHMQLHPNDRSNWGKDEVWGILEKGVIGLIGTDFESSFRNKMKIGDIVVIRPILALVEITSDAYDIEKSEVDPDVDWFTTRRNIKVLSHNFDLSKSSEFNKNLFLLVTGAPLSKRALEIAQSWYKEVKMEEKLSLLKSKKQIILQGAPGTGKTYTTAELAVRMIDGDNTPSGRKALMERYQELSKEHNIEGKPKKEQRIFFTTFHPSLDYEEFIEGYKPDGQGSFTLKSGIFKDACRYALSAGLDLSGKMTIEAAISKFREDLENSETQEEPMKSLSGAHWPVRVKESGFDVIYNETEYNDINNNKPGAYAVSDKQIETIYYQEETKATQNYGRGLMKHIMNKYNVISREELRKGNAGPVILIIDEINRGHISKIFGELITLLEADKRRGEENALSLTLPYSGENFTVPPNLYIIGTMNTSDRTIGYIDYALRRRFAFVTIKSERSVIETYYQNKNSALKDKALKVFDDIDSKIITGGNNGTLAQEFEKNDLMIGHSYFMAEDQEALKMKLEYEIKPLLLEYLKDGILINRIENDKDLDSTLINHTAKGKDLKSIINELSL